jgi:hypothetical protein
MNLPAPEPGLVVRYDFLWSGEAATGRVNSKDRPSVVALVVSSGSSHGVGVLPITHSPPAPGTLSVEIPAAEKQRLGLDHARSWIIVSELNLDVWPAGLTSIEPDGKFSYGFMSRGLLRRVLQLLDEARRGRSLKTTRRD